MKTPAKPPQWHSIMRDLEPGTFTTWLAPDSFDDSAYLSWDRLRFKTPPLDMSHEQWWAALRIRRISSQRALPFEDVAARVMTYNLTDSILRSCEDLARRASGQISLPELATGPADRNRYVVNSLIEEAITSSQLEGASTSRRVAKEMLRTQRRPTTKSERMIVNNYLAMERVREWADEPMTVERVLELHRVVTDGTLEDPADAGRLQPPDDTRIAIYGDGDQVLHRPPAAEELPERLQRLCDFANGSNAEGAYLPAPVRAIIVHFMVGYDHYFVDGNGRTARALFYWCMLRNGYWLTEYVTISKILKNAPSKYAGAYLLTEDDDNDLTHFVLYQLDVLRRAVDELETYLQRKTRELRDVRTTLDEFARDVNHRQLAVLDRAMQDPDAEFTVTSHAGAHRVSGESARQDLMDLQARGLLRREKRGKAHVWLAAEGLGERAEERR